MQQEKKKPTPAGDLTDIAVLTNDQQLFLMDQVKWNNLSIDDALKTAKQLSQESQNLPVEPRKEPKSSDVLNPEDVYNFAIILYQNGFNQLGTRCCMQIDFLSSAVRILVKSRINKEISFRCIREFSNEANSNQLKILSTVGVLKFTANSEDKHFIFELLGMVVLDNECTKLDTNKKKELDRQSMNLVFRNRNILKEGTLEKRVDANMLLWLERYVVVKEGEFSYNDVNNSACTYLVQLWTDSIDVKVISDSEFSVTHKKRQYIFRITNIYSEYLKSERDSWIQAFWQASARKNIKTKWLENVRLSTVIEEDTPGKHNERKTSSPPVDYADSLPRFKRSISKENNMLNVFQDTYDDVRELPEKQKPILRVTIPQPPPPPSPATSPHILLPPLSSTPAPPPLPSKEFGKEMEFHSTKELKHFPIPNLRKNFLSLSVWKTLPDLTPNLKRELLEEKFAVKQKDNPKTPLSIIPEKVFMNEKKAQNVMILMRGRFLQSVRSISSALVSLEELNSVSLEDIRTLQKYQPDIEEIEMYRRLQSEEVKLKPVDNCMMTLSLIPCFRDRLELIHTIWSFNEDNTELVTSINLASKLCEEILHSKRFLNVLAYVLAIFNYLNTSGKTTANALPGFDLNYLSYLGSIRGEGNYTVLKVLKCHLKDDKDNSLQEFPEDLKTLLQCEPFSIKSFNISLEVWKQTIANIKNLTTSIQKKMKNPSESDAKFFAAIKAFQNQKMKEHDEILYTNSQIQKMFNKILKKFALSPQTSSEKLVENLQKFITDYINIT